MKPKRTMECSKLCGVAGMCSREVQCFPADLFSPGIEVSPRTQLSGKAELALVLSPAKSASRLPPSSVPSCQKEFPLLCWLKIHGRHAAAAAAEEYVVENAGGCRYADG